MASDRKVRKFLRQWRRHYPSPSPWVDQRANKQLRRSERQWLAPLNGAPALRRRDVAALIEWRFVGHPGLREDALRGITGSAHSGHARRCIVKALATASPTGALDCLLEERGGIPGWGPDMASAVLAACRPDLYAVADGRSLRSLRALDLYAPCTDDDFVRDDWWPYLRICRKLAARCDLRLRQVGQALWAGADAAPRLPAGPKAKPLR